MNIVKLPSSKRFCEWQWNTEQTYNLNFANVPKRPGIYLVVRRRLFRFHAGVELKVLYVGMSRNIKKRVESWTHAAVLYAKKHYIASPYDDIVVYFFEVSENLRAIERDYIKSFRPTLNTQHKAIL